MPRSIHFGVFVLGTGNHTAGWRYPGADQTFLDITVLQRMAAIAERGLFDFLFLGDGLAANLRNHPSYTCRLEPLTLLSALAMTNSIFKRSRKGGSSAASTSRPGRPITSPMKRIRMRCLNIDGVS